MKVELLPVEVPGASEEFKGRQFYQLLYRDSAGREIWRGSLWLPSEYKRELKRLLFSD